MKNQVGITEPTRDWFPLSLMGAFADFADLVHGPKPNGAKSPAVVTRIVASERR